MSGKSCRAVNESEFIAVCSAFTGMYEKRNRALFVMGLYTGFRINELLSVRIKDVMDCGVIKDFVTLKETKTNWFRTVELTKMPKKHLAAWVEVLRHWDFVTGSSFVFCSKNGRQLQYHRALQIIHEACNKAAVYDRIGTHTMRKSFVVNCLTILNEQAKPRDARNILTDLKELTGHKTLDALEHYIPKEAKNTSRVMKKYGNRELF